jgi:hypothetical protein
MMGLNLSVGGYTTSAGLTTLLWTISTQGNIYLGPIGVSANFEAVEENYGTVSTELISVDAFYDDTDGYYQRRGFRYTAALRNQGDGPVIYNLSIGTFG